MANLGPTPGSSYVPSGNNTGAPNSYDFQTQLKNNIAIAYQQNILDSVDLPTYHFKFFMVGPDAQTNGTYLDPSNQVIIAESGISDYTIDNVEIESTCQQSYESGTGTSNIFHFRITEPSGASLLDKMFYTALDLGIGNWVKSPFYLELSFRGRDTSNSLPLGVGINSGAAGLSGTVIGQMRWVWPIQISNMKANITKVGTIYDFSATIYSEFAFNNTTASTQQNIVLSNVSTVGDAIRILQDKLNRDASKQLMQGYLVPDVYEITLEDSLINLPIVTQNNNTNSSRANSFGDLFSKTFSYPPGTSIDYIINNILATTEYFQTKIKNSKDADSREETTDSALQQLWRIIPHTVPYKYDSGRQSNAHYIRYYVVKFDKGNLPPTATQSEDMNGKLRYRTYKQAGILRKKYDYIFTGQNDQVEEFNLEFNNGWAAPSSRFAGLYYNSSHKDPGMVHHQDLDKKAEALEAVAKYVALFNDSSSTDTAKEAARLAYEGKLKQASNLPQEQLDAIARYVSQAQNPNGALDSVKKVVYKSGTNSGAGSEFSYSAPRRFVSDQEMLSEEAIRTRADRIIKSGQDTTIRPISSVSAPTEKELSDGVEDKATPGRNYTSALFSQAMAQTAGGDYGNIKLKVKGDPYWLQPAPFSTTDITSPPPTIESIKAKVESTANFNISTNFMLVRLRTPKIFDNTQGQEVFTEVDTISALYSVNIVRSTFSNGRFLQELSGTIDPPVEITKFLQEIEEEERQLSGEVPPQVVTAQQSDIPGSNSTSRLVPNAATVQNAGVNPLTNAGQLNTSIPGINANTVGTIGQSTSIPGLPPTSNLTKFTRNI